MILAISIWHVFRLVQKLITCSPFHLHGWNPGPIAQSIPIHPAAAAPRLELSEAVLRLMHRWWVRSARLSAPGRPLPHGAEASYDTLGCCGSAAHRAVTVAPSPELSTRVWRQGPSSDTAFGRTLLSRLVRGGEATAGSLPPHPSRKLPARSEHGRLTRFQKGRRSVAKCTIETSGVQFYTPLRRAPCGSWELRGSLWQQRRRCRALSGPGWREDAPRCLLLPASCGQGQLRGGEPGAAPPGQQAGSEGQVAAGPGCGRGVVWGEQPRPGAVGGSAVPGLHMSAWGSGPAACCGGAAVTGTWRWGGGLLSSVVCEGFY